MNFTFYFLSGILLTQSLHFVWGKIKIFSLSHLSLSLSLQLSEWVCRCSCRVLELDCFYNFTRAFSVCSFCFFPFCFYLFASPFLWETGQHLTHTPGPPWEFSSFCVHFYVCESLTRLLHATSHWEWRRRRQNSEQVQQRGWKREPIGYFIDFSLDQSIHPSLHPPPPPLFSLSSFLPLLYSQPARVHSIWEQFACHEACDLSSKEREREKIFLTLRELINFAPLPSSVVVICPIHSCKPIYPFSTPKTLIDEDLLSVCSVFKSNTNFSLFIFFQLWLLHSLELFHSSCLFTWLLFFGLVLLKG